ncbi:Gfo/Idh/MocA family protein [Segnochrobactraceae bacterium EtOH-i3]
MTASLRAAVVGYGYFGRFHARHYHETPGANFTFVADQDPDRRAAAAADYGVETVADHRDLIGKVDLVSIVVPTSVHHAVARDLIDAGIHVLIEKPIAADLAQGEDLVRLADARDVVLQVGHIERHSAAFRALLPRLSRPLYIESERISPFKPRATDVDVVLDLMIHDIDLVIGMVGSRVVSADAIGAPVLTGTADLANARIAFENGVVATVTASRVSHKTERMVRVFQRDSYIVCDFANLRLTEIRRDPDAPVGNNPLDGLALETVNIPRQDSLANEIAEFLSCIREKRRPIVDGRVGCEALRVANLIKESMAERRRLIERGAGLTV